MNKYIVTQNKKSYVFYSLKEIGRSLGLGYKVIKEHLQGQKNKVDKLGFKISVVERENYSDLIETFKKVCLESNLKSLIICYSKKENYIIILQDDENGVRESKEIKVKEK